MSKKHQSKGVVIFFLVLISIYRFSLDVAYSTIICPLYAYLGFVNKYTFSYYVSSLFLLFSYSFVLGLTFCSEEEKASYEIVVVLYLLSFVPFSSLCGFGVFPPSYIVANCLFWFFLILFCRMQSRNDLRFIPFVRARNYGFIIRCVTVLFFVIVLYISGRYTHFRFNFHISNVYELRSEAKSFVLPTVFVYLFSWSRFVVSILLAYYIREKKTGWVFLCVLIQLLSFGIDGSKTTLFLMVFVLAVNLFPPIPIKARRSIILVGCIGMICLSMLVYIVWNNLYPISLFVRRLLFIPADISAKYFDFFTTHQPDYFRQSFLRFFGFKSPYPSVATYISELYYGVESNANNGLMADAITNFGSLGILFGPVLYALVFRLLDKVTDELDSRLCLSVTMYMAVTLNNSFLLRALLTHGLLVTFFLLYIIKREQKQRCGLCSLK